MALPIESVRAAMNASKLKFTSLDASTEGLSFSANSTSIQVVVSLQEEGEYIEARTLGLATCPPSGAMKRDIIVFLTKCNMQYRICFAIDPQDGEIIARTTLPIEDNSVLPARQLHGLILGLVAVCDKVYPDIARILEQKPGMVLPEAPTGVAKVKSGGIGCLLALAAAAIALAYLVSF